MRVNFSCSVKDVVTLYFVCASLSEYALCGVCLSVIKMTRRVVDRFHGVLWGGSKCEFTEN